METSADQRASSLADQIEGSGLPEQPRGDDEPGDPEDEGDDEPEEEVWQVTDSSGTVVRASQSLSRPLPTEDSDEARLPGADHGYVVVTEDASAGEQDYVVSVAVSLEDVDDSHGCAGAAAAGRCAPGAAGRRWHHLDGGHPGARTGGADPA